MDVVVNALNRVQDWQQGVLQRGTPYTGIRSQAVRSTDLFTCGWTGLVDGMPCIYTVGHDKVLWSLQSTSKPEMLVQAFLQFGGIDGVNQKIVNFHGAGHFASAEELALTKGLPRNGFVNPGAMRLIAALLDRLGGQQEVYDHVVAALNNRLRPTTQPFFIDRDQAEPVFMGGGGSGNIRIAQILDGYGMLFGREPEEVVETYHTVCATTGTIQTILEGFFHYVDGKDVFGNFVLPENDGSWELLMAAIMALGSYTDGVWDLARRCGGKTGGSGLLISPTFAGNDGMPPGLFVAASPGLGPDLNPWLPMRAAEEFGRITGSGVLDDRRRSVRR